MNIALKSPLGRICATLLFGLVSATSQQAFADRCNANAGNTNYHSIEGKNKYVFAFDVNASTCNEYSCRGWVKFAIRYHYRGDSQTVIDRTLLQYSVDRGNSQSHVSMEHWVGNAGGTPTVVDDVAVEEVSCSTP